MVQNMHEFYSTSLKNHLLNQRKCFWSDQKWWLKIQFLQEFSKIILKNDTKKLNTTLNLGKTT